MPRPLLLLLPVVLLCSTIWVFFNPMWNVVDEPQHFGYVESLAELGHRPDRAGKGTRTGIKANRTVGVSDVSSVTRQALDATNGYPLAFNLYARPSWAPAAETQYDRVARTGRRDDGGAKTGASSYPPLYYAFETLPYRIASSGTALDRAYLMRWFSSLWVLVTTVGGWLLIGEVLGRRRLPQLVGAATLGLWPMISWVSAGVNPDGMLFAGSTLSLWLMARIARRGVSVRDCAALVIAVILTTLVKVSGAALAPAAFYVMVAGIPQVRQRTRGRPLPLLGLAAVLFLVPVLALLVANSAGVLPQQLADVVGFRPNLRRFASYLWQFYLPRPGFMTVQRFHVPVISDLPVYNLWLGTSWGTFGWVDIWFPRWIYRIFLVISLLVLAGAGRTAVRGVRARRPGSERGSATIAIGLAIAALSVLAGVHLQDFKNGTTGGLPFAQGRYLFPVAGIGALAVAGALMALPVRVRSAAAGGWLAFLIVFQGTALALLATRFYA